MDCKYAADIAETMILTGLFYVIPVLIVFLSIKAITYWFKG